MSVEQRIRIRKSFGYRKFELDSFRIVEVTNGGCDAGDLFSSLFGM